MWRTGSKIVGGRAAGAFFLAILFVSPWFWFPRGVFDAAGDDHKLHFFAPENYVSNFALYVWNSYSSFSNEYAPYYGFPFIFIPYALRKAGLLPGDVQKLAYGSILVLGFAAASLLIQELLVGSGLPETRKAVGGFLGALAYTFSPIVFVIDWQPRMSEIFAIFVYPLLLYFLVRAVNRRTTMYLVLGALVSLLFSFTIHMAVPWFAAFAIGAIACLAVRCVFCADRRRLVTYTVVYLGLAGVVNALWMVMMLEGVFFGTTVTGLGGTFKRASLGEFLHNVQFMDIYSTLLMLPAQTFFGLVGSFFQRVVPFPVSFAFLAVPATLGSGLLLAAGGARRILLVATVPLLVLSFLITVNVTDLGPAAFAFLMERIPGFVMFKNFQSKFSLAFSLFYAVALGISAAILLTKLARWRPVRWVVPVLLVGTFGVVGKSLLRGDAACVSPSVAFTERLCPEIPAGHLRAAAAVREAPGHDRVFVFPMARYFYMVFRGANQNYYVAMPYLKVLTGRDEFGGIESFNNLVTPSLPRIVLELADEYEFARLAKLLWMVNVNHVLLYEDVAPEFAQMFLFKYGVATTMEAEVMRDAVGVMTRDLGGVRLYAARHRAPGAIVGRSSIAAVDDPGWLSRLVYTEYLDPAKGSIVSLNEKDRAGG